MRIRARAVPIACFLVSIAVPVSVLAQEPAATAAVGRVLDVGAPRDLAALLGADPRTAPFVREARAHRLQVLLAEPVDAGDGRIVLRRSRLGDPRQYFYPASTVKLAAALAALAELNRINADTGSAFDLDVELAIRRRFDGDPDEQRFALRRDLRLLFLVSDNAAYNHCFEFVGPARIEQAMHEAGFASFRLWHRLDEARPLAENLLTRPVVLRQDGREHRVDVPARDKPRDNEGLDGLHVGDAYLRGGQRVDEPMLFTQKNAVSLEDLQDLLVETVRPGIDTGKRGFTGLSVAQRAFVVQALGELPSESVDPRFDRELVPDHHCKFVLPGVRAVLGEHGRVHDKIGRAYGFTIENAYVEDARTGRGFFLAAVLYTNPDGVLNDDRYAYAELADPFFAALGEIVTRAVLAPR